MSGATNDSLLVATPQLQKNLTDLLGSELVTKINTSISAPISEEKIKLLNTFSPEEMANYNTYLFNVYSKLFGIANTLLPPELVAVLAPTIISLLKTIEKNDNPGFTAKFVDSAMNDPDVLELVNTGKLNLLPSSVDSITVLNGGRQSGGVIVPPNVAGVVAGLAAAGAIVERDDMPPPAEAPQEVLPPAQLAAAPPPAGAPQEVLPPAQLAAAAQGAMVVRRRGGPVAVVAPQAAALQGAQDVLAFAQADAIDARRAHDQVKHVLVVNQLGRLVELAQPMSEVEVNMHAGAYAAALMGISGIVTTLAASAAGAGAVISVGVVLLLFTMIRKGGIGAVITGAISTIGATVTTVGQSAVKSAGDWFRSAEAIKARADADAEKKQADNIKAVQDTINNIFELLGAAFNASREGLVFARGQVMGYQDVIPKDQRIWFGISIYIALVIGVRQLIKSMDRTRVRRETLENLSVIQGVPAQPAAQPQRGIAGLLGMGGATRHRISLPTRRAGRSSSSSKRSYTHRRQALLTGMGGYRPIKTDRKV